MEKLLMEPVGKYRSYPEKPVRKISGLVWARPSLTERFKGKPAMSQAQKKGKLYEKRVLKSLKKIQFPAGAKLHAGQWLEFVDENGRGLAQPDWLLELGDRIIIGEVKLTAVQRAWEQIEWLYRPLVESIYQKPVVGVQVCKNLFRHPVNLITELQELFELPVNQTPRQATWHLTI